STDDPAEPLVARRVAAPAHREDDAGARRRRRGLDALDDLDRPRALELCEHELDESRCGTAERPAAVAVAVEEAFDARPRRRGDVGPAVEDLRGGRERDTGLGREFGERDTGRG